MTETNNFTKKCATKEVDTATPSASASKKTHKRTTEKHAAAAELTKEQGEPRREDERQEENVGIAAGGATKLGRKKEEAGPQSRSRRVYPACFKEGKNRGLRCPLGRAYADDGARPENLTAVRLRSKHPIVA